MPTLLPPKLRLPAIDQAAAVRWVAEPPVDREPKPRALRNLLQFQVHEGRKVRALISGRPSRVRFQQILALPDIRKTGTELKSVPVSIREHEGQ